jgi:hypothetical protein
MNKVITMNEEIKRLRVINADLLEACRRSLPWIVKLIEDEIHLQCAMPRDAENILILLQNAIAKAEGVKP